MIAGLVMLAVGAIVAMTTKYSVTFLIAVAGYVVWRWGQNELDRQDKERASKEQGREQGGKKGK
jgi:chromate transport protein ChrA